MSGRTVAERSDEEELPSFEDFFASQYERLFRAMWLLTGSKAEGEDLAQEAMARVFERWSKVRSADSPASYVYRVAFNLNHRRLRRRRLQAEKERATYSSPASASEARIEILDAIGRLPRAQREALVLIEWLGFSPEEAGKTLGIAPASVRTRMHRARATLRSELGGSDE